MTEGSKAYKLYPSQKEVESYFEFYVNGPTKEDASEDMLTFGFACRFRYYSDDATATSLYKPVV